MLTDLRIADLVTLLAVRRTGSVTGAARELKVSPSQVSKAITRLEGELHVKLLIRGARGVTPSDACLRIVPQLEDVVTRLRDIHRKQADQTHELTIAAPSVPQRRVPAEDRRGRATTCACAASILAPALIRSFATQNLFDLAFTVGQERLPRHLAFVRSRRCPEVGLFCVAAARTQARQTTGRRRAGDDPVHQPDLSQRRPVDAGR